MGVRGWRVRIGFGSCAGALLIAVGVAAPGTAAPAGSTGTGEVYVALGDSYTSGPLVPNQHGKPIDCARSDRNYPSLIAAEFQPETFIDVSCGSAETEHMTEPQTELPAGGTNPPQFSALREDATLVTVGIGGNDAGLVGVAEKCAQLGLTAPNGNACRDRFAPGGNDTVAAKIEATEPKIAAILETIHRRSPDARVAIFGYPDVLPDERNCYPMVPLSPDDVRYIDELIVRINTMIAEQAAKHDADYVDTYADSGGHDVCKLPPERWFEGLVPTEPAFPLHPNAKGFASMARSGIAVLKRTSRAAPVIQRLRVKPRRVRAGKPARVRFLLDREAEVSVRFASKARRGKARAGSLLLDGEAGRNKLKLRPRRIGRMAARFRLKVVASEGGLRGEPAKARFRVIRPRR